MNNQLLKHRIYRISRAKSFLIGLNFLMIIGFLIGLQGCRNTPRIIADTIFYNGKVISVDSAFGIYSGIAIKDGKILAVGSDEEVLSTIGDSTYVIDLEGQTVVPGLIDNHAHPVPASTSELAGALPNLKTISDLLQWISDEGAKKLNGEWIIHPKFFFSRLLEKRWPTLEELDQAAPNNPVFLDGSYAGIVNSKAIEISELDRQNDPGLLKDAKTNKLSGIMRRSAFSLLSKKPSEVLSTEGQMHLLKELFHEYNSVGITSITAGSGRTRDIELMNALYERGDLTVRVFQNILLPFQADASKGEMEEELLALGYHTGDGNEWIRVGALKAVMDGGILTGTAFMRKPWGERAGEVYGFSDPKYKGVLMINTRQLTRMITTAYDNGWKFTAHVTGGGGVDTLLRAYEIVHETRPLSGKRFSIIHGNFFSGEAIEKMKSMGIYADMQPMWLYKDVDLLNKVLDEDMLINFHPNKSMVGGSIIINGGSDHMVKIDPDKSINPYNPFLSIYALVSRTSENGTVFHPEEAISREEALKLYTINNAYSSFEEKMKGSIEKGKWADIVVLSDDILTCETYRMPDIKSVLTMVGGKIVYELEN